MRKEDWTIEDALRLNDPEYRASVVEDILGKDTCRRGTHHIADLTHKASAVTVGMACEWQDGKPLGTVDYLDRMLEEDYACFGLVDASLQLTVPLAILFVQQNCGDGEEGMLSSVQYGSRWDNDGASQAVSPEDRIVLPGELEDADGIAVLFFHEDPSRLLDVDGLVTYGDRYLRDWLVEDYEDYFFPFWLDARYEENRPCGMVFYGQCIDPSVEGTGITVCAFKSKDEVAKVSQLGWERGDIPMGHLDVYGLTSEAGFGAVISMATGRGCRVGDGDDHIGCD
jgi:hypothetical protein